MGVWKDGSMERWEYGNMKKDNDDNTLYVGRLYLFGFFPLWRVKHTKNEWKKLAMLESTKIKVVEYRFEENDR